MKKLLKLVAAILLFVPMFYSCGALTGDLEDVSPSNSSIITHETGGGEDGGTVRPGEEPG